ncbi:helix-turn-helix domain-containing protein [Leifsonia naganoensis]|uniref:Transcriptional regulator with XRE-family HTH domain n=1 Tax=Leifsonia naganoensis TaxID=150025 RepID=A0A853DR45_9MICO|nr:helix-turn-helix domain-containing protein [Leifsonia naganoensis]NYK09044.1 transcriptional regulator with XRE-family HTH domain [Leifsonia naganoensis]
MPRPHRPLPNAGDIDGWPTRKRSDPVSETARIFSNNLRAAIDGWGYRELGRAAGLDHNTIRKILAGESWPDLATIARLERVLGPLWPGVIDWEGPEAAK